MPDFNIGLEVTEANQHDNYVKLSDFIKSLDRIRVATISRVVPLDEDNHECEQHELNGDLPKQEIVPEN